MTPDTKVVIEIVEGAGFDTPLAGHYVKQVDFEAQGGRGEVFGTLDLDEAQKFESMEEAIAFWKTQSVSVPLRRDGRPNRPLTAFSCRLMIVVSRDEATRWIAENS